MTFPLIQGWGSQKNPNSPTWSKVKLNDSPRRKSADCQSPLSLVVVWPVPSWLVQVTFDPRVTVMELGSNLKSLMATAASAAAAC